METMQSGQPDESEKVQSATLGNLQPAGFPGLPAGWVSDWDTFPSSAPSVQIFEVIHHRKDWGTEAGNQAHRALLVLHGMGEHGGRYLHLAHYLQDSVDAVICIDQRGHGRSEGLRGHCDRFSEFTEDLALAISRAHEKIIAKDPRSELHVLGHSFGGLVTLRTHFLHATLPVTSVIASSPLLALKMKVPTVKGAVGRMLSGVWGNLQLTSELDPTGLSHDSAVAAAYTRDRLVHDKVTPRMFTEMLGAMEDTASREAGFAYPLLLLVPLQDPVTDPEVSQSFYQQLKIRDKQLRTYPGFFHESLNELGKERVFEDITEWIKNHGRPASHR